MGSQGGDGPPRTLTSVSEGFLPVGVGFHAEESHEPKPAVRRLDSWGRYKTMVIGGLFILAGLGLVGFAVVALTNILRMSIFGKAEERQKSVDSLWNVFWAGIGVGAVLIIGGSYVASSGGKSAGDTAPPPSHRGK
jgi:hypothetical protein